MGADNRLPAPPADLARRKLSIKRLSGPVFRIHLAARECPYFGRSKSERFDDPQGEFGILYGAAQPEGCFAEIFLRALSLMLVSEADLQKRALSEIRFDRTLRCADLTGAGLRRLSCDNRISTEVSCETVRLWSRALFIHPEKPDGILYRSRHNPKFVCVALFDRCQGSVKAVRSKPLLEGSQRAWTVHQLSAYGVCLEPAL